MMLDLDAPLPLPAWLPDETLYSLLSRYHALSGHGSAAQTAFALFGRARAGTQHDFPQHLDALWTRTIGVLGSPEEICRQRTVLPFYLPLRPLEDQSAAVDSLRGPSQGMLKYRLGLLTSRFRANHPLKACPDCMRDDAAAHGIAYWHRTHQFPGVWICPQHGSHLTVASVKSNGALRFGWILPAASQLRPASTTPSAPSTDCSLSHFADLARNWSALPAGCCITVEDLAAVYRRRIADIGLPARRTAIAEHYAASIAPLRAIPELQALPATTGEARPQIDRWVFNPRGGTHPLRHLSMIFWLFPNWASFLQELELHPSSAAAPTVQGHKPQAPVDPRRAQFLTAVTAGTSVSTAARQTGIAVGTGIAWAAAEGIRTPKRPKALNALLLHQLTDALRQGLGKAEIATMHGVPVQAVTRLLRSEPGLRAAWLAAQHDRHRAVARSAWGAAMQAADGLGISVARAEAPKAYAWLYRNDRDWLRAAAAQPNASARPRTDSRIDWDARDLELSDAVMRAAASLAGGGQSPPYRIAELCEAVPELRAKLGALQRLPLTSQALRRVTRQRRQAKQTDLDL